MLANDYTLELTNIFHTGQVEPGSCLQRLCGSVQTGLILKDISLEVRAGEVLAILGSKGSGKRALLEVISRRSRGPTRGQILLDGTPMTLSLYQRSCGYVSHRTDLIPSLTAEQTLHYAANLTVGSQVSGYVRSSRVRGVLADLALSQVARRNVANLTTSEHRRLVVGMQLIKDPALLLLDEPTADLDPLATYLIVSMLSSHARRRGRIVILTMEKPRSDVFPFLDRAAYLCLGDLVYAGPTRLMLEYFRTIGFPCPQLENPLMYYLCLSTVDRRSRERFIESNTQIIALVEKFKLEGAVYRRSSAGGVSHVVMGGDGGPRHKLPFTAFGKPSGLRVGFTLYQRMLASVFNLSSIAAVHLMLRLLLMPCCSALLFLFYQNIQDNPWTFVSRNGLLFNSLLCMYLCSIITTATTYGVYRTRYYQEAQEGVYSGPLFLLSYWLFSLPFSLITVAAGSRILFEVTGMETTKDWCLFAAVLWACYLLAEQQTVALMMVVYSSFTAALASLYISLVCLVFASGALRSYRGLSDWLVYLTYGTQARYAGAFLSSQLFSHVGGVTQNCTSADDSTKDLWSLTCRYPDGASYITERYGRDSSEFHLSDIIDTEFNLSIAFAFPVSLAIANCLLYLVPLPAFTKAKFRD
ncbi:ATP-binding cassette sub-family G member 5-like [Macrosteles quadrilineatus]|uniref:ATP-binding cassette sub-family G member 5-like n=1 Tax=Macrosteles quadrilineatus TaxID=74068 RepID=UPI0023E2EB56|nr:ATP-binding cassette sub-family G member 5-like [Macrosteles quadrilineatus]